MNKSKLFKGFALVNFICLTALFLLFRNGSINTFFQTENRNNLTSPNGGTPLNASKDSVKIVEVNIERNFMPSSKSIVIRDYSFIEKDSLAPVIDTLDSAEKELPKKFMGSSKSAVLFDSEYIKVDLDTVNLNKKKTRKKRKK